MRISRAGAGRRLGVTVKNALIGGVEHGGRYLGVIELGTPAGGTPFQQSEVKRVDYICAQFADFWRAARSSSTKTPFCEDVIRLERLPPATPAGDTSHGGSHPERAALHLPAPAGHRRRVLVLTGMNFRTSFQQERLRQQSSSRRPCRSQKREKRRAGSADRRPGHRGRLESDLVT